MCRRHHSLSLTVNGTLIGFSSYCGFPSWPGNAKKHHWLSSRCGPSSVSAAVCQSVGCSAGASSCHFLAALTRLLSLCSAQLFSETAISGVHNWVQCFACEVSPHLLDDIVVTSGSGWRSRRSLRRGRPAGAGTEGRAEPPRRRRLSGLPGLIPLKPLHDTSVSLTHWLVDVKRQTRNWGSGDTAGAEPETGRLVSATLPSVCVCQWCQATEFDSVKAAGQSPPSQSVSPVSVAVPSYVIIKNILLLLYEESRLSVSVSNSLFPPPPPPPPAARRSPASNLLCVKVSVPDLLPSNYDNASTTTNQFNSVQFKKL